MKNFKHTVLLITFLFGLNAFASFDVFAQTGTAQNSKSLSGNRKTSGDSDKIAQQIMKLNSEYEESSRNPKAEDFDRFYTEDYMVTVRVPARISTRAENEARFKDPNFRRGTIESLTNDDVKVRVYGDDTAIATGSWKRVSKDADGKDTSASGRFTRVWVKQNGKWLLAAAHYSPFAELAKRQ
jgi:uncharacterized protein (TIGR02246 family)